MKRLSATVLAIGLLASGVASAQSTRYYGTTDRYGEEPYYDYARVVRVDPIIDNGYGRNDGYANTTTGQRCYYRDADDVYARDGYRDDVYGNRGPDDVYGNGDYRDVYGQDGYGDRRYPAGGTDAGRTVGEHHEQSLHGGGPERARQGYRTAGRGACPERVSSCCPHP